MKLFTELEKTKWASKRFISSVSPRKRPGNARHTDPEQLRPVRK